MIIDTHCHLIDEAFSGEVVSIINNAQNADVQKMIIACCDENEYKMILPLCEQNPGILYPTIGIHPENLQNNIEAQFHQLFDNINNEELQKIVAVGEIGLDLHWDKSRFNEQKWLLMAQIEWALQHDLPVLLHIRDAMQEFLQLCRESLYPLATKQGKRIKGILHCYSGTEEEAMEVLQYGDFLFGVGGTLTYKKSQIPSVAKAIGLNRIVLETDAPYLAPVPHRGHRNEPAYTAITCLALAEILHTTNEEVAVRTTENARTLFKI